MVNPIAFPVNTISCLKTTSIHQQLIALLLLYVFEKRSIRKSWILVCEFTGFLYLQCVIKFWNKIDFQVKNKKANDVALNWYQIKIKKKNNTKKVHKYFQFQIHFIYVIIFCLWFQKDISCLFVFDFFVCVCICALFLYGDTIWNIY